MTKLVVPNGLRRINWFEKLGILWCKYLHAAVMWPIHGHYSCRVCHRQYPVLWAPAAPYRVSKTLGSDGSRTLAQRPLAIGLN